MITVLYFAACRERAGTPMESLDLGGSSVAHVLHALAALHPGLQRVLPQCRVAVDQAFVGVDAVVPDGAEVALIPPVAGGASTWTRARVRETALSLDACVAEVRHPGAGAVVVMMGTVRDNAHGDGVASLEYEAYVPMAEKVIDAIVREVEAVHPGTRGAVEHRTGHLAVGEVAVTVAVSAPHREAAFAACARVIERLKEDAPIWKREHRTSGVVWVGMGP